MTTQRNGGGGEVWDQCCVYYQSGLSVNGAQYGTGKVYDYEVPFPLMDLLTSSVFENTRGDFLLISKNL
jgi:hypothetical protein